ncbi:helix-turn-helix domain-containing protein [Caldithrix abyssi]|uniref:ArsR family transcriptional regulator n=2 Tax=Caldithrix abyssi DSM 13497 TaxID=880073 RepID=H1XRB6_CALAY|nr:hypothetical protein [Caldithrix abyssi]EHO42397.1 hypothetical protein Calab_2790 [Caldithrix abyssi DSM 13497]
MLKSLITSDTRIKLLMRFFLNPSMSGYLRQLASEFGESTNGIRKELNKLTEAKILKAVKKGRNIIYQANTEHPLFEDIHNIVMKSIGIDKVATNIIQKLGKVKYAFIRGDYAVGKDTGLIDLVVVGDEINFSELERVRKKTETLIERKINVLVLTDEEYLKLKETFASEPILVLLEGEA